MRVNAITAPPRPSFTSTKDALILKMRPVPRIISGRAAPLEPSPLVTGPDSKKPRWSRARLFLGQALSTIRRERVRIEQGRLTGVPLPLPKALRHIPIAGGFSGFA